MHVVVVGGGISGIIVANSICNSRGVESVVLIDPKDFVEMSPGVIHSLSDDDAMRRVCAPYKRVMHRKVTHVRGTVVAVGEGVVSTEEGAEIKFDVLCVATGAETNEGMPWRPAAGVGSVEQRLEQLRVYRERIGAAKSVLVIGGGVVGVEMLSELVDEFEDKQFFMAVYDGALMSTLPKVFGNVAMNHLRGRKNVKICLNTGRVAANESGDWVINGDTIHPDLVLHCYNKRWNTLFVPTEWLDASHQIVVDGSFRSKVALNVFSCGDCCNASRDKSSKCAIVQAYVVARNIRAVCARGKLEGDLPRRYTGDPHGTIIGLGKRVAIFRMYSCVRFVGVTRSGSYFAELAKRITIIKLMYAVFGVREAWRVKGFLTVA